jgi:myo-inositol-1(or 4)-monophosphatase
MAKPKPKTAVKTLKKAPKAASRGSSPVRKNSAPKKKAAVPKKAKPEPKKRSVKPPQGAAAKKTSSAKEKTSPASKTKPSVRAKLEGAAQKKPVAAPVKKTASAPAAPVAPPKEATPPLIPVARASKAAALPREFLVELASAIRAAVLPYVHAAKGREVVGSAASGDATFELDAVAEKALLTFLKEAKRPVAYYSEDAGYTTFSSGQPQNLLVIDPIDGSRAAKSGFESCVVSVASTRVIERPRMIDIENACVMEIVGARTFFAERGKGARIYADGAVKKPKLSKNTNLETVSWSMTVPARPAELIFPTAAKLIDLTSLKGGFFSCNSTSFSLTRLLTTQLDACIDIATRYLRDIPEIVEDQFINAGRGAVIGIAPYDIAASVLIAQEAGCAVTDAYGKSFDEVLLLDSSVGNHRTLVAAANAELHEKLMNFFDIRIRQYEELLRRRAGKA